MGSLTLRFAMSFSLTLGATAASFSFGSAVTFSFALRTATAFRTTTAASVAFTFRTATAFRTTTAASVAFTFRTATAFRTTTAASAFALSPGSASGRAIGIVVFAFPTLPFTSFNQNGVASFLKFFVSTAVGSSA